MLCQFTFKNFKSYKNEAIFDLQATNSQGFNDSLLHSGNDSKEFLPVSVIYGPNAGGKTNVLDALHFVVSLVTRPIFIFENKVTEKNPIQFSPFLFDDSSFKEPTEFELFFRPNNEYEYKYIIKLKEKITEECLYRRKIGANGKSAKIFERYLDEISLGSCINKPTIKTTEINDQMPYLSFLSINYKLNPVILATNWFENCFMLSYANPVSEHLFVIDESDEFKKKLITLMNDVGINVSNFEFVEKSSKEKSYDIFFEHVVNGQPYHLNFSQESDGTKKLFNILPLVIIAISEGKLLVFDELDAKLHPKLLKFIIMLFKNPEINKNNAQLVFTSHDVSTMKSSVFRTDEIWFACKLDDESSDLYSLCELRDENGNHIHPSAAYDKQYLEGRYGADPYFQNMMDWK